MSPNDLENLGWGAGGDGASVEAWPAYAQDRPEEDYDELMGAWLAERTRVVEAELLLVRARDLLLNFGHPRATSSVAIRREIRRLLGEIDDHLD